MRQLLRELAACALLLATFSSPAPAQQGGLQLTAAAHSLHGDAARLGGETVFEPDLGVSWLNPGTRFGTFQLDFHAISREGQAGVGRAFVALRGFGYRGVQYSIEAGDTHFSPAAGDYRLRNLYTPSVNFAGLSIKAKAERWSGAAMAGRATAIRNIFGSDTELLDQDLAIARGSYSANDRLEVAARLARIQTTDLKEYRFTIADSTQGGAGVKFVLTPLIHLVADASAVRFRRRGETNQEEDFSALAGATVVLAKGWLQVNASRFSPGELPILTQPFADRRTLYSAGEYDVFGRVRLFGGWESFETNLYESALANLPAAKGERGFGGVRLPIGKRSSAAVRFEEGDRRSRLIGASLVRVSDTGMFTTDWQTVLGRFNGFTRYARRTNVESESLIGSYTQHDGSGLLFATINRELQLFGSVTGIHNVSKSGSGHTFWQFGGGGQMQLFDRGLWMRTEGLFSRNVDLLTDRLTPQHTVNFGLNGELTKNTMLSLNVYADRLPGTGGSGNWLARSTVRVTRSFPNSATVAPLTLANTMARHGGTGSLTGMVYSDWNSNGVQDPEDQPLENIPVRLLHLGNATTARDGAFAFLNIPIGLQQVGIDLSSLPVDFDPPPVPQVQVHLGRGDSKHLAFGLVPLGTIAGRVVRDANNDGVLDPADTPIDGAVVVLDGGARSELARGGRFRFDAVRSGEHTIELLHDGLPPGSTIIGQPRVTVSVGREQLKPEATFLVNVGQRLEIRRIFGAGSAAAIPSTNPMPALPAPKADVPKPERAASPTAEPARRPAPRQPAAAPKAEGYTIQVAAFRQRARATTLVQSLKSAGFAAYLVVPSPNDPAAPYRVRVGTYPSPPDAEKDIEALESRLEQKVWLVAVEPPK